MTRFIDIEILYSSPFSFLQDEETLAYLTLTLIILVTLLCSFSSSTVSAEIVLNIHDFLW